MSKAGRPNPDAFELVHGFVTASLQGELREGEDEDFAQLLQDNANLRRVYVRYLEMTAHIPRMLAALEGGRKLPDSKLSPLPVDQGVASGLMGPALGFLGGVGRNAWGFLGAHATVISLAAVVLLGIAGTMMGLRIYGGRRSELAVYQPGAAQSKDEREAAQPAASRPAASPFVARLAAAHCEWVDPESALSEGAMLIAGQKLELASGQVQIMFQSGAEVNLHGPAIFEIESAKSAFLTMGQLSARAATPEAHGFTVRSRTAATVDLGTEFSVMASEDGHSRITVATGAVEVRLANGRERRRLGRGEAIEVEPGRPSVIARIEPGDGTPAFRFPTIEPPSNQDYADASQGHARISVLRGKPHRDNGSVEVLLDGHAQSNADSPPESFCFENGGSGLILLDLGLKIPVKKVNTYSWHQCCVRPADHIRATQKYDLYGASGPVLPAAGGDLAAAGWTLIARVNTDEFFGFPRQGARPAQQGVSITAAEGGVVGRYRYLLWDVRPTPADAPGYGREEDNTFYGEFDVYAEKD